MDHPPARPLCDHLPEDIGHLLLGCVFAREVWARFLRRWNYLQFMPVQDVGLGDWWSIVSLPNKERKEFASQATPICWTIWKQGMEWSSMELLLVLQAL